MDQDWRLNQAISVALMHELLRHTKDRAKKEHNLEVLQRWILAGDYFCICFVLSLLEGSGGIDGGAGGPDQVPCGDKR